MLSLSLRGRRRFIEYLSGLNPNAGALLRTRVCAALLEGAPRLPEPPLLVSCYYYHYFSSVCIFTIII